MTEAQKEILIAKMLDSPSCLSDDEVDTILHDDEMRDIYEISCAVSGGVRSPKTVLDMDEEWHRFSCRRSIRRRMRWLVTAAAMLSGIVMVSFLAGILKEKMSPSAETAAIVKVYPQEIASDTLSAAGVAYHPGVSTDEETSASPVGIKPVKIQKVKHHRAVTISASTIDEMEVEEYLRIQQAAIDNEIALQYAQVIKEETELLNRDLESIDGYNTKAGDFIKRITVQ